MANEEMQRYWNEVGGPRWVAADTLLSRFEQPLLEKAVEAAAARGGERVLDVGCGSGRSTALLAKAVGASGRVVGVDISEPMLALARQRLAEERHVELHHADAQVAELVGPFDLVFSIFGVMFFDDPVVAFSNLRRVLDSGGRLTFLCWQAAERNPWMMVPAQAAAPFLELPRPEPGAPGPFALADPERLRAVLGEAGFGTIEIAAHRRALEIAPSLSAAIDFVQRVGPLAVPLGEAEEPARERALAAIRSALEELGGDGPVRLDASMWLVRATA